MKFIKKFFLQMSATDKSVLTDLPEDQLESAESKQVLMGIFIFLTGIAAFVSGSYAATLITDSQFAGILFGIFWASFIVTFDRAIATSQKTKTAILRVVIAILIGFAIAVPLEVRVANNKIVEAKKREIAEKNDKLYAKIISQTSLGRVQNNIDTLQILRSKYIQIRDHAEQRKVGEIYGEKKVQGMKLSGDAGYGDRAKAAEQRQNNAQKRLNSIEKRIQNLKVKEDSIKSDIQDEFDENKEALSQGLFANYEVLENLKENSWGLWLLAWVIRLLIIIIETAPALWKITEKSVYDHARLINYKLAEKSTKEVIATNNARIEEWRDNQIKKIKINPDSISLLSLNGFISTFNNNGVNDHNSKTKSGSNKKQDQHEIDLKNNSKFKESFGPTYNSSENLREDENESNNNSQESSEKASESEKKNGRPYFLRSLILVLLIAFGLELFTPAAPFQRLTGDCMVYMPDRFIEYIIGEDAFHRFENAHELFNDATLKPEILSSEGKIVSASVIPSQIPKFFSHYLLQIEDHRYNDTFAIDWIRTGHAIINSMINGNKIQGVSGIIQQLARKEILKNQDRSISRKFKEFMVACGLRTKLTKKQLLNYYIYSVYLGKNTKGFQKAALKYFNTPLSKINRRQGLALITLLNGPNYYLKNPHGYIQRYKLLANSLFENNIIDSKEKQALLNQSPNLNHENYGRLQKRLRIINHFSDYLFKKSQIQNGEINSTVNVDVSQVASKVLKKASSDFSKITGINDIDGFVLVAHKDSLICMIGSKNPYQINNALIHSPYSPASTQKPYVYSEFIAQGGALQSLLPVKPHTFHLRNGKTWKVANAEKNLDRNLLPMEYALSRSLNVPVAYLATRSIADSLRHRLKRKGFSNIYNQYPSAFLGSTNVIPLNHFRLLQAFVPPYGLVPTSFKLYKKEKIQHVRVWAAETCEKIAKAMNLVITDSLGTLHQGMSKYGWNPETVIGKTGTASNNTSASIFISRPGGLNILMGVFSRSGKPMKFMNSNAGVSSSSLIPYVSRLLGSIPLKKRVKGKFNFKNNEYKLAITTDIQI